MLSDKRIEEQRNFSPLLWLLFGGSLLLTLILAAWAVLQKGRGDRPVFSAPPQGAPAGVKRTTTSAELVMAGSGSNLPLTRILLKAFAVENPHVATLLYDSIGSSGGLRAVRDGVISVGLVSRPLKTEELAWGLRAVPYARTEVVLAAHPGVAEKEITAARLLDLYGGKVQEWNDGQRLTVLQREPGDSSLAVMEQRVPGFADVNRWAYRARRWRVIFSDQAMLRALQDVPGAVGITDAGLIGLEAPNLRVLRLIDSAAGGDLVEVNSLCKVLSLVTRRKAPPVAADFVEFVQSVRGRRLIEEAGYLPMTLENERGTPCSRPER